MILVTVLGCWPVRGRRTASRRTVELRDESASNVHNPADRVGFGPTLGAALSVPVGLTVGSPLLVVVGPILAFGLWRERARRERRRLHHARSVAMLGFAESTVAGLRAGGSLSTAVVDALERDRLAATEPFPASASARGRARHGHPGLDHVSAGLGAGRTLSAAFADAFGDDTASGDDRLVATTVVAVQGSGASAVEALERVGDALRERHAWQEELRTQGQQALSSAAVMSALPLVFGIAAALADPGVSELYRTRWLGALCAGFALLLGTIGWEWQQRLLGASR